MINWEQLKSEPPWVNVYRAKVPNGWLMLIAFGANQSIAFYPDPQHEWDGTSLP